jgi:hypothetical protein
MRITWSAAGKLQTDRHVFHSRDRLRYGQNDPHVNRLAAASKEELANSAFGYARSVCLIRDESRRLAGLLTPRIDSPWTRSLFQSGPACFPRGSLAELTVQVHNSDLMPLTPVARRAQVRARHEVEC